MTEGFLSRWSQRKQDVRQGKPQVEPVQVPTATADVPVKAPENAIESGTIRAIPTGEMATSGLKNSATTPLPTLDDVKELNALTSDFKPFVARGVAPEVKNAAMKKLFTDPHFNVMDGMDVYIDDYSVSTPIPESILRQMTSAKFLGLFDDDEKQAREKQEREERDKMARDVPDGAPPEPVTQSEPATKREAVPALTESTEFPFQGLKAPTTHDHPDMRLQPDHALGAPAPGRSAG